MVIDCDLEGSTGLASIHKKHPESFVSGGIMERGNFSAAAGFGAFGSDRVGVFSTFSAFLEMCVSEITMARLKLVQASYASRESRLDVLYSTASPTCFAISRTLALTRWLITHGMPHESISDSKLTGSASAISASTLSSPTTA